MKERWAPNGKTDTFSYKIATNEKPATRRMFLPIICLSHITSLNFDLKMNSDSAESESKFI